MNNRTISEMIRNPLLKTGNDGDFVRLILAEAAMYGMPPAAVAVLDDMAAMLGMYQPMSRTQAAHVAGPLIAWRSHPQQVTMDRVDDVERLLFKQRCLLAFGGMPPGHLVGSAEICCAIGNTIKGLTPEEYREIFMWASIDVLKTLTGETTEQILRHHNKEEWRAIPDNEVLLPTGRLYETYQTVATSIRRETIERSEQSLDNSRKYLRPVAAAFRENHIRVKREAEIENLGPDIMKRIDRSLEVIDRMFPDLKDEEGEIRDRWVEELEEVVQHLGLDISTETLESLDSLRGAE